MTNEEIIAEGKRMNSTFGTAIRTDPSDVKKVLVGVYFFHGDQPWELTTRVDLGGEDAALTRMLPPCLEKLRELTT